MEQRGKGYQDLWNWFGLSYSSFCVLPRVVMQEMPDEWQAKMAALLAEWDERTDTTTSGVHGCTVRALDNNGKLMKMPEDLLNYRRPDRQQIIEDYLK